MAEPLYRPIYGALAPDDDADEDAYEQTEAGANDGDSK
jgi:hypothetical protein